MTSKKIAVVDYGMGNLHSVAKALQHAKPEYKIHISSDADVIRKADSVVVPGVGAIRDCMAGMRDAGVDLVIKEIAYEKPMLGICIGMQTLMQRSEENGGVDCLNLIPGDVRAFGYMIDEQGQRLKVPHMGWNNVYQREAHPIWNQIEDGSRFYFVHSYYVHCDIESHVLGSATYGTPFDAVIHKDNIIATQFHPEKSSTAGIQLLKNFLEWDGSN